MMSSIPCLCISQNGVLSYIMRKREGACVDMQVHLSNCVVKDLGCEGIVLHDFVLFKERNSVL